MCRLTDTDVEFYYYFAQQQKEKNNKGKNFRYTKSRKLDKLILDSKLSFSEQVLIFLREKKIDKCLILSMITSLIKVFFKVFKIPISYIH